MSWGAAGSETEGDLPLLLLIVSLTKSQNVPRASRPSLESGCQVSPELVLTWDPQEELGKPSSGQARGTQAGRGGGPGRQEQQPDNLLPSLNV